MFPKERDPLKTGGLDDVEMAIKFYDDFGDDGEFIGKVVPNEFFNEWIEKYIFPDIDHGWGTPHGAAAFNGYRSTVRGYLKNGVMSPEYASKDGYEPYIVKVRNFGEDLIITEYSEHVLDSAQALATKRQKTIKNQSRELKKGFKTLKSVYGASGIEVQLQEKLVESHNELRLHIEGAFDEMFKRAVRETVDMIEASKNAVKQLALFEDENTHHEEEESTLV